MSQPILSQVVTEEIVLGKCRYFVDVGLWPRLSKLDPISWLSNFSGEDRTYALHLLNSFIYFSSDLIDQLFVSAFSGLSNHVASRCASSAEAFGAWRTFISGLMVVRVTGELPNDTDSGYLFARRARDKIGVPQSQIVSHAFALFALKLNPLTPVVFVDDFVGSGLQFVDMWNRLYQLPDGDMKSFASLTVGSMTTNNIFYCPLVCTSKGADSIRAKCSALLLIPAHEISSKYSALDSESVVWPDSLLPNAAEFLLRSSHLAGIPDKNGGVGDWRGFHKLGLTISFAHGTPDATLPIFSWKENGWKPLVKS